MVDKGITWLFGLSPLDTCLVLVVGTMGWFFIWFLNKREKFHERREIARDEMIKDFVQKLFEMLKDRDGQDATLIGKLNEWEATIKYYFRNND